MTRLKSLELVGFKSFADRTHFDFPDGITAIVGPNGSGKSNVVDAIKWVLGEQSVRSLRGREMTDVIFAGSAGRKPLNSAETSLVFDNASRMLASDSDEVRITRRVYRSGESEYLVNGQVSRLRDIREIFSGTGAATEAYSVIEQGRVDALLVASGRDRRLVFEEAAGITRFRNRRTEALRRLDRTEQNRQRLVDLVGEIATRLSSVRQQAAKARRYQEMSGRLKALRLHAASVDLAEVDAAAACGAAAIARIRDDIGIHDAVLADGDGRLAAIDATLAKLDAELGRLREAGGSAERLEATERATLSLLASRHAELAEELCRADAFRSDLDRRLREADGGVATAHETIDRIDGALAGLAAELDASRRRAGSSSTDISDARFALEEGRASLRDSESARSRAEADVARLEEAIQVAGDFLERATAETGLADARRLTAAEAVAPLEAAVAEATARLGVAEREIESLEVADREAASRAVALRDELADWLAKQEACRERARVLQDLAARREGVSRGAKAFLESGPPGLRGIVAEWIDADPSVARLVDAALGGLAGWLVVDSRRDFIDWIDHTPPDRPDTGRVGCILVDQLPAPDEGLHHDGAEGVVGRLDRMLTVAETAPPGIERLLGRVWVVENLAVAIGLVGTAPPGVVYVTPKGEAISSDGRFEFGAGCADEVADGLVSRTSHLASLAGTIAEFGERISQRRDELADLDAAHSRALEAIRDARSLASRESAAVADTGREIARARAEHAAAEAACARAAAELLAARDRHERLAVELARARGVADAARSDVEQACMRLMRLEREAADIDRNRDAAMERLANLRVDEASCRQRLVAARDRLASVVAVRDSVAAERLDAHGRSRASGERLQQVDLERLAHTAALAEASWEAERLGRLVDRLDAERSRLVDERHEVTSAAEQARGSIAVLAAGLHDAEIAAGEVRHRRERILERIRDDYGLDLEGPDAPAADEAATFPADRAALDREIEDLRRRLAAMPSVNLDAVTEADELGKRHADMQAQLDDLTDAKRSIESLIARIDDESRALLATTIETVRGHFRGLFENLFGGGQADIVLDPNMDLLDTTVEIVARPPGKEPRSISLLSGGEKTMTCVALLLAIFKSRPSPFCVLDEVDAALDEANVDRFVGVLRDFLSSTQFILVTHSKKTMAAADNLYGVTMEESGVSKRVAVRLERARSLSLARAA
jgi:chromosome segregation protein